jgi:outer membrane protein TolC
VPAPRVRPALVEQNAAEFEATLRASPLGKGIAPVSGGLTGDQVAERTVNAAPSIGIKQMAIERAAAQVDQTLVRFLPQLTGKAGYTRLSKAAINFGSGASVGAANGPIDGDALIRVGACPDGMGQCVLDPGGSPVGVAPPLKINIPLNSFSLSAQLAIPISDYILSLSPARKGPIAARESAELARDAERIKVETDARLAYFNWLRAVTALIVLEDALTRSEARMADVQNLFDAGAATRSDVLRVDALISAQQAAINDTRALRNTLEQSLAVMMNEPVRPYEVGEDLLAPPPDIGDLPDLDTMVDEALQNRLELRSLNRSIDGFEEGIKATRASYYPRLDAFADATYANPNQRFFPLRAIWRGSWSAGVQLTYSINQTLMTKAQVRGLKADKRQLVLQAELMRRGIKMEVVQAYGDRIRAIQAIELNTRSLASSAEAYRVASENYKAGAATTNDIIDAEGDQIQAGLRTINAHIDLRVANARLLYASGRRNPSGKQPPRK